MMSSPQSTREVHQGSHPADLEAFFSPQVQLVTIPWSLPKEAHDYLTQALPFSIPVKAVVEVDKDGVPDVSRLIRPNPSEDSAAIALRTYLSDTLEVVACLFGSEALGVRIIQTKSVPCPRFHVDQVMARAVLTLSGPGSEYVLDHQVQRAFLGHGAQGQPDEVSGLLHAEATLKSVSEGELCLFKGEDWPNNSGKGLVHRSPQCGQTRCLMTIDLIE